MSTIREQITLGLIAKIKSATSVNVWRSRVTAYTRRELPAVTLELVGDQPDTDMLGVITWGMIVRFSVLTAGDVPDAEADPIVDQIHKSLVSDKSLGGLTMDIEPADVKFELYNGDGPRGVVSLAYRIAYRTSDADLSQQR